MDKHPFEAAIEILQNKVDEHEGTICVKWLGHLKKAIAVLREWPKYAALIEAAKGVDKDRVDVFLEWARLECPSYIPKDEWLSLLGGLRVLLEALPEKAKEELKRRNQGGRK